MLQSCTCLGGPCCPRTVAFSPCPEPGSSRLAGFFGRLPIAMVSLGIVLLVSAQAGSYGLAGTVVSAYLIANALLAIVHGRLVDRFGQHRVLPAVETVHVVALGLMMWAVEQDWPTLAVHALAAVAGGALPQIGACVRARWSHVLDDGTSVQTAYAFESVVDEALFVTGPTAVTLLATAWDPVAGLAVAMGCGLLGVLWLSTQRGTEPPDHRQRAVEGASTTGRRCRGGSSPRWSPSASRSARCSAPPR